MKGFIMSDSDTSAEAHPKYLEEQKIIDDAVNGLIDVLAVALAQKHYARAKEKEKSQPS